MLANLFQKSKRKEQSTDDSSHIVQPSKLCSACSRFIEARLPAEQFGTFQPHHGSKEDFMRAIQSDCGVCTLIRDILGNFFGIGTQMRVHSFYINNAIRVTLTIKVEYTFQQNLVGVSDDDLILDIEVPPIDILQPYIRQTLPANDTGSKHSLMLAREWLQQCQNTHRECSIPSSNTRWQPLRLLKLKMYKDQMHAKLHVGNNEEKNLRYLSLSHCWGTQEIFKLTTSNLKDLETNIPIKLLPAVFRHAMFVTLQLGYKYLWIDSLCICQNSRQDWLEQSSTMGLVYRYADCNIAATAFSDGQRGLFVHRDPKALMPRKVIGFPGIPRPDSGTKDKNEYYIIDGSYWRNGVTKAPLNHRGWVVQERLLSSRTLHFGDQQLFWECLGMRCCEVFPKEMPRSSFMRHNDNTIKLPFEGSDLLAGAYKERIALPLPAQDERQRRDTYTLWHRIIQAYSRCKLTRAEDKLPAISGLAQHFQSLLGDDYLAGLWRGNLVRDLLWNIAIISKVATYDSWLAPTWSWASIDSGVHFVGGVSLEDTPEVEHARVLDVHIDPLGDHDTGPLIGATLKIQGRVIPLTQSRSFYRRYKLGNGVEIDLQISSDVPGDGIQDRASGIPLQPHVDSNMRYYRTDHTLDSRQMFALPLLTQYYSNEWTVTKGLVLTSNSTGDGRFSRIGMFTTDSEDSQQKLFASQQRLRNGLFLECDSDLYYTITMV